MIVKTSLAVVIQYAVTPDVRQVVQSMIPVIQIAQTTIPAIAAIMIAIRIVAVDAAPMSVQTPVRHHHPVLPVAAVVSEREVWTPPSAWACGRMGNTRVTS